MEEYIKLSDLRKVKGIGNKTLERIKETLLEDKEDTYISKYNEDIRLDTNSIYKGDCLELMNGIEDKSIDMILCDLPYGTTQCKWDTIIPFDKLWKQYKRIIKDNGVIVLFGSQPFTSMLVYSNLPMFRYEIIWDKVNISNPLLAKKQMLKCHENILIFYKRQPTYHPQFTKGIMWKRGGCNKTKMTALNVDMNRAFKNDTTDLKYPKSIQTFSNANNMNRFHPTQKPIKLLEYLIRTYTNENELVLDNCIGSGSTAIACINTNRKFTGIEKDEKYYNIAKERVNKHIIKNSLESIYINTYLKN